MNTELEHIGGTIDQRVILKPTDQLYMKTNTYMPFTVRTFSEKCEDFIKYTMAHALDEGKRINFSIQCETAKFTINEYSTSAVGGILYFTWTDPTTQFETSVTLVMEQSSDKNVYRGKSLFYYNKMLEVVENIAKKPIKDATHGLFEYLG